MNNSKLYRIESRRLLRESINWLRITYLSSSRISSNIWVIESKITQNPILNQQKIQYALTHSPPEFRQWLWIQQRLLATTSSCQLSFPYSRFLTMRILMIRWDFFGEKLIYWILWLNGGGGCLDTTTAAVKNNRMCWPTFKLLLKSKKLERLELRV